MVSDVCAMIRGRGISRRKKREEATWPPPPHDATTSSSSLQVSSLLLSSLPFELHPPSISKCDLATLGIAEFV